MAVALAASPKTRNVTGDILASDDKVNVNFNVNLRGVALSITHLVIFLARALLWVRPVDLYPNRLQKSDLAMRTARCLTQRALTKVGAFFRFGAHNPNYGAWQFSDPYRSLAAGLSLKGTAWSRPNDTVGLAEMAAGIGHAAQA